ncbi:TetR family transcriptional regulator [Burkholderia sp. Bp9002]|nr:TetR family transcriptional regulator [Burkholderia sp. Bp9002]
MTKRARLTREQRRLDTRERLIATARALFIAKGFADTSIEHIAEGAGYTRGAFYAHFEHKREPLIEILRRDHDRMIKKLRLAAPDGSGHRTAAESADIATGWECFPLWVEVHLYALRDAGFRQIIDRMQAEVAAPPGAASGVAGTSDRMPSSAESAAVLGVALLCAGSRYARHDEPMQDAAMRTPVGRAPEQ